MIAHVRDKELPRKVNRHGAAILVRGARDNDITRPPVSYRTAREEQPRDRRIS